MTTNGGDAAEQVVRMMLLGSEITLRLGGSVLKNMMAFLLALAKNHKVLYGKTRIPRLLKETRDLRSFTMTREQFRDFRKRAGAQKLLYAAVSERGNRGDVAVMMPVSELARANQIFAKIQFSPENEQAREPEREETAPKKESRSGRGSRDTKDKSSMSSKDGATRNERESVEGKLQNFKAQREKQTQQPRPKARAKPKAKIK